MAEQKSIAAQQSENHKAIVDTEAAIKALLVKNTAPNAPELVSLDEKIEKLKAEQRRLTRMQERAAGVQTDAERDAIRKKATENAELANKLADARIPLAAKIDAVIADLGALLDQWAALGAACRPALVEATRHDPKKDWQYSSLDMAGGTSAFFTAALEWALFTNRIGIKGIPLAEPPRRPLGEPFSVMQASQEVAENIAKQVEESLKQQAETHGWNDHG